MPRKSRPTTPNQAPPLPPFATTSDTPWGGYVNLTLDENDKVAYHAWLEMNHDYLDQLLGDVLSEGVQFSIKYAPAQQSFIVTLTTKPRPDLDMRCCMSSWSNSPSDGIYISLYKWVQVLGKDMSDYRPSTSQFARWG